MRKHKKNYKPFYITIGVIGTLILTAIIITVVNLTSTTSTDGITVDIIFPQGEIVGGAATKYKVTGTKSAKEANAAIIKKQFQDDESFRAITDQELKNIVDYIALSGCGQITESYTTGPPAKGARNWTNYGNEKGDSISVYILDDKYLVSTDCQ